MTGFLKHQSAEIIVDAFDRGRWADVLLHARIGAVLDPGWCFAWKASGTASRRLSSPDYAISSYDRAVTIDPTDDSAWIGRAAALVEGGDVNASIESFLKGISIGVDSASGYLDFALLLERIGRLSEAGERCRQASLLDIFNHLAWFQLGILATARQKLDQAVKFFERAIVLNPGSARGLCALGSTLRRRQQLDRSLFFHKTAIAVLGDDLPQNLIELGFCLLEQRRLDYAFAVFRKALCLSPESSNVRRGLAIAFRESKRFKESTHQTDISLRLSPYDIAAWDNKGTTLKECGEVSLSRACYEAALVMDPSLAETWSNRGNLLRDVGLFKHSLTDYERAVIADPSNPVVRWNLSLLLLSVGEFSRGWLLHEDRFSAGVFPATTIQQLPKFSPDLHRGSQVLVTAEQGLGDELMFCSLLVNFSRLYGPLTVQVDPRLSNLFRRSMPSEITIGSSGSSDVKGRETCVAQISMGSLPLYAHLTSGHANKSGIGYLRPDPRTVDVYRRVFRERNSEITVGISWRSTNETSAARRNIPPALLCEVVRARYPRAKIVSLQYDSVGEKFTEDDAGSCDLLRYPGVDLTNDLDSVAAMICACDAVITIGNAVAHLAGAVGKNAAVLLPYVPSWRWMLTGDRTHWYPSLRLFRKKNMESEWREVVLAAVAEI